MRHVDVNGTTLAVRDEGSGEPIVFIHGYPLDHTLWLDQVAGLSGTHRCLAPDLRGYGDSAPATDSSLTMELFAEDLAALVDTLELGPVHLVGLSMGGYAALAFWEATPHLVKTLTLAATRAGADGDEARAKRDDSIANVLSRGRTTLAAGMVDALLGPDRSDDAVARLRSMIEGTRYETIVGSLRGMRDRKDREGLLEGISVPTLVIAGADDTVIPASQTDMLADRIPGASLVTIEGSGHLAPIEQPEAFTEALRAFVAVPSP